jgi:hypothetical protein
MGPNIRLQGQALEISNLFRRRLRPANRLVDGLRACFALISGPRPNFSLIVSGRWHPKQQQRRETSKAMATKASSLRRRDLAESVRARAPGIAIGQLIQPVYLLLKKERNQEADTSNPGA